MSNTMNTPAEVLETAYPLRIRRYEFRPNSGGAGEFRGGLGLRRDIEIRDHTSRFSLLADRHQHSPYGLLGGEPGERGAAFRFDADADDTDDDEGERIPQKSVHDLPAGTLVSVRTPGAGGYGDPDDREEDAIERDLRLGKITLEHAREHYGFDEE